MQIIEGQFDCPDGNFVIIAARFNGFIVDSLVKGAQDALLRHGIDKNRIKIVWVPGAVELPLVAQAVCKKDENVAVIALGAVIRGATAHFDYVAGEAAKGLAQVSMQAEKPVIFGVLTTENIEQAVERAGTKAGNKGFEAAMAALEMVSLMEKLK
ncbi:MAG: 6,7-dimethyl-8-ribityllumazine synthase [bacterium]